MPVPRLGADKRQIDLEEYLQDIPDFLLAATRPADYQERVDKRIREWRDREAAKKAAEIRRPVPRLRPKDFTE